MNVHYAFVEENGIQYAYCNYFDVTAIKESELQAKNLYESLRTELDNLAGESLISLRLNLTQDRVEECRGNELFGVDVKNMKISENFEKRLSYFPLERDKKIFKMKFCTENILKNYQDGFKTLHDIFFSERSNGRKCFIEYTVTTSQDPATGDIIAFANERDYNNEMVTQAILHKALVEQYDMITYLVDDSYGVVIGDSKKILNGSIFPKENHGSYSKYIEEQVKPVLTGSYDEQKKFLDALSLESIEKNLSVREPYEVNISCYIDGRIFHKRFVFYLIDRDAKFYVLLKSDTTKIQREQLARNEQLKSALDNANQANIAKTAFLSSMSHEIRTPMNAIIGLDSIALKEPNLPVKVRDYLEKIGKSAHHMLDLINDILDMSRIESGKMILKNEEFSFSSLIEQINTMFGGQCHEKGLEYDCKIIGKVEEVYIGDDTKLKQVLINILGNAVKFTHAPGKINFTVEQVANFENKSTLKFVVSDTGVGISEDYLPHIFEVFTQEDATTSNAYGGTGLGMPITKNIVEMMNGKISVKSKKNVGSEFTFNVTLKNSDKIISSKSAEAKDLNVLVIDDDPITLEHAQLILNEVGIRSDAAKSGEEALEKIKLRHARHDPYNLLLIDLHMPEQNGIEVTKKIRDMIGHESAIIILTAYNWDSFLEEALNAGVDRFMAKPLFASNVMSEFNQAIEKKNISRANKKKLADLNGKKILMAEDMPVNAEIMKEILKMRGMEVEHAENGKIAVDMFNDSPENYFDAVLMDIRMPVMDGLQATENIRALNRKDAKTIPIIAMTANAFDEDVQRSLQAGMNAHLTKPVEPERIYLALAEMISE